MTEVEARQAWNDWEARLRPYVARRVAKDDVDDVLQEIFVRMHRGLSGLRDEERFGAWAFRIAHNVIVDSGRTRARDPLAKAAPEPDLQQAAWSADEVERLQAELVECVALFVAELASPYREAVTLTELQGLTQRQAAELLGVSISGIKSRVQRGRSKIRQRFEQCCRISTDCRGRVVECRPRGQLGNELESNGSCGEQARRTTASRH